MLENPAPPSLNFSSPMTYSSKERSFHIAPSSTPPPSPEIEVIPLKNSVHFPIAIAVCNTGRSFNLQPQPHGLWGSKSSQRHSYYGLRLC